MNNNNFAEILKCIKCNSQKLVFTDNGNELLCKNCSYRYIIKENVPVMLSGNEVITESELHKKSGTAFQYIDHYQKDAYTSDYFEKRDSGTEHDEKRVREYISTEIKGRNGTILDVGCGKAWVAALFCPRGFDVVSMDISIINTSKALKVHPHPNHHAIVADAYMLPFPDNTFDFIIASEIIEHVYEPALFIRNLLSVLKPGGKLIVTTPYKEKIQYSLCIHCNKPTPLHAHLHSFNEHILKSLYTGDDIKKWYYTTFGNKVLYHLRTHVILKYLPFTPWKIIDKMFNGLRNASTRILVVWEK